MSVTSSCSLALSLYRGQNAPSTIHRTGSLTSGAGSVPELTVGLPWTGFRKLRKSEAVPVDAYVATTASVILVFDTGLVYIAPCLLVLIVARNEAATGL